MAKRRNLVLLAQLTIFSRPGFEALFVRQSSDRDRWRISLSVSATPASCSVSGTQPIFGAMGFDGCPTRMVVLQVLQNHDDSTFTDFRGVAIRFSHASFSQELGLHETRCDSVPGLLNPI